MIQVTLSQENYQILHKMICQQLDQIFIPYDEDLDYQPTEEHQKILDAVTLFSSYNPNPIDC
jgi:hypothetical protein